MTDHTSLLDKAIKNLWVRRNIRHDSAVIQIAFLLRFDDWRPLEASWWRGKEVCIIGADINGNFLLRHCDGTIRYWNHGLQKDTVISASVIDFVGQIE